MNERLSEMRTSQPNAQLQHTWVPYNQISANLKRALIADEDSKFLNHHGFDWEGMRAAAQKDLTRGHIVAGGSTISQQLAKNLLLSSQRTPWRKLEEALVTVMLEHMMNKRRIFEIYLNTIEWGSGIFGAQAAAAHYDHTTAAQLSAAQAALLAAMVPDPRYYDNHPNARGLKRRVAIIQARMPMVSIPR